MLETTPIVPQRPRSRPQRVHTEERTGNSEGTFTTEGSSEGNNNNDSAEGASSEHPAKTGSGETDNSEDPVKPFEPAEKAPSVVLTLSSESEALTNPEVTSELSLHQIGTREAVTSEPAIPQRPARRPPPRRAEKAQEEPSEPSEPSVEQQPEQQPERQPPSELTRSSTTEIADLDLQEEPAEVKHVENTSDDSLQAPVKEITPTRTESVSTDQQKNAVSPEISSSEVESPPKPFVPPRPQRSLATPESDRPAIPAHRPRRKQGEHKLELLTPGGDNQIEQSPAEDAPANSEEKPRDILEKDSPEEKAEHPGKPVSLSPTTPDAKYYKKNVQEGEFTDSDGEATTSVELGHDKSFGSPSDILIAHNSEHHKSGKSENPDKIDETPEVEKDDLYEPIDEGKKLEFDDGEADEPGEEEIAKATQKPEKIDVVDEDVHPGLQSPLAGPSEPEKPAEKPLESESESSKESEASKEVPEISELGDLEQPKSEKPEEPEAESEKPEEALKESEESESLKESRKSAEVPQEPEKAEKAETAEKEEKPRRMPVIPQRPSRGRTESGSGLGSENRSSPAVPARPAKPEGKAPPPKPKKLSSKIAAFQKMFNEPAQPPSPGARSLEGDKDGEKQDKLEEAKKLSSERASFASNLQNMMGRGIALPGMARPDMFKSSPEKEEPELTPKEETTKTPSVPRRAKGPRGKRLPKQIQEADIKIEPRFKFSYSDSWKLSLRSQEDEFVDADDDLEKEYEKFEKSLNKVDDLEPEFETTQQEPEEAKRDLEEAIKQEKSEKLEPKSEEPKIADTPVAAEEPESKPEPEESSEPIEEKSEPAEEKPAEEKSKEPDSEQQENLTAEAERELQGLSDFVLKAKDVAVKKQESD